MNGDEWATYCSGDILDYASKVDVIAHQVNCLGIMGGGLALQIKNKWPGVDKAYRSYVDRSRGPDSLPDPHLLGKCLLVESPFGFVANLFGQYDIGGGRQTNYEALSKALKSLRSQMSYKELLSVAFPMKLGCGLAGGDWDIVSGLIRDAFAGSGVSITIVEYFQK